MRSFNSQSGASMILWLLGLAVIGFGATIGLRLFPVYLHAYTVNQVLKEVAEQAHDKNRNEDQIWSSINKRLNINDISGIKRKDFSFTRENGTTRFGLKYQVRTKLIGNLDGVAQFEPFETTN